MSAPSLYLALFLLRCSKWLLRCSERLADRTITRRRRRRRHVAVGAESGQATAEYALVLLGAAAVALMLAAWAAKTGKLGELFDSVVDQLIGKAG